MAISVEDILNILKTRYGQLVTSPEDFFTHRNDLELACASAIAEYAYFKPFTKILNIMGSPSGTYLGAEVLTVRNTRVSTHFFDKISPKLPRRHKHFDAETHILYSPYSMPLTVECGCLYTKHRTAIKNFVICEALAGDINLSVNIPSYIKGTLTVTMGGSSWTDASSDYSSSMVELSPEGSFSIDTLNKLLLYTGSAITESTPILLSFNPVYSTIEGVSLRDKLFIDLCVGHCLVSLGNIKAQLRMEGDVVGFAEDNLAEQGQALILKTLEELEGSASTYANL